MTTPYELGLAEGGRARREGFASAEDVLREKSGRDTSEPGFPDYEAGFREGFTAALPCPRCGMGGPRDPKLDGWHLTCWRLAARVPGVGVETMARVLWVGYAMASLIVGGGPSVAIADGCDGIVRRFRKAFPTPN